MAKFYVDLSLIVEADSAQQAKELAEEAADDMVMSHDAIWGAEAFGVPAAVDYDTLHTPD